MIRALLLFLSLASAVTASADEASVVAVGNAVSCEVRFFSYVGSDTMEALLSQIEDPEVCLPEQRVRLTVQSGGGEVDAGMFAYKMLRKRPGGVDTHVEYSVASMGVIVMLAGDRRTMASDAHLLIHQVTQYAANDYELDKLRELTEGMELSHEDYVKVVAERTGLSLDQVETLMAEHSYLTAEEALRYGFITEISNS